MKFNKVLRESKSLRKLNEATIETVVKLLKSKEKEKKGVFKTEKYFDVNDLQRLFGEFTTIQGASKETLVPVLRNNGFTDEQIKKLKPFFIEKISKTELDHERSKDAVASQTRTGVKRDKAVSFEPRS